LRTASKQIFLMLWGALLALNCGIAVAQAPLTISAPEVVMIDESTAYVLFTTSVPARTTVEYRSTNGAIRTISEAAFETEHAIPLSGLIPGLRYEGTITATAQDNTTATATIPPFTATEPQTDVAFEAEPQLFFIGPDEAVVAFTTNRPSTAEVQFGRTGMSYQTVRDDEPSRSHVLSLPNLIPNLSYTFIVTVRGQDGSISTTAPALFTVAPFERNLEIQDPQIFQTGENSAFLIFRTTRPARSVIELTSTSNNVSRTFTETEFETEHAVLLPDLVEGQSYSVRIRSRAEDGEVAVAFVPAFMATNQEREVGFEIQPQVVVISATEAVVTFSTTLPSTSRVDFGLNGMLNQTVRETTPTRTHALNLTGLTPGATYTFVVTVQGPDGSVTSTAPASFTVVPTESGMMPGDVDLDGFVDVRDVVLVLRYIVRILPLTLEQIEAADVDNNDVVDVRDAVRILRIIVGLPPVG